MGLCFDHPNYVKIYGFFSDKENFYIIKEYLEEGCLLDIPKISIDQGISVCLNQVLYGVSSLSEIVDLRNFHFEPSQIAKSQVNLSLLREFVK